MLFKECFSRTHETHHLLYDCTLEQ